MAFIIITSNVIGLLTRDKEQQQKETEYR